MITQLFWAFVALSALLAVKNWRLGLALIIVVGTLQDPVRKMTPGAPAFMVLSFFPVWIGLMIGIFSSREWPWRSFGSLHPIIQSRIRFFGAAMALATVIVFQYGFAAWKVAAIGLFTYTVPLMTLMAGFAYARSRVDVSRLIMFYCLITAVMLVGGVMEVLNLFPQWKALGTEAMGMHWVRYVSYGHTIDLIAGFYRSPDIMGWHAATLSIFSLTLALYGKAGPRWFWLGLAVWGAFCVFISGRNKMISMTVVWVIVVALLHIYIGRAGRVVTLALAGGILAFSVLMISGKLNLNSDYDLYASQLVGGSTIMERINRSGTGSVAETFRQSGFFGKGIGTAAQGIQYLGLPIKRSWQEGGAAKILVELGVTGFIAAILVAWATARATLLTIRYSRSKGALSPLQLGLAAYIPANIANFIISQQAYSDGLIMVVVATALGMMLSSPYWLQLQRQDT
ncbi:hypothetical protein [Mariprofundus ferrooxydans]|uniref:O-antigen polymerase n=1 Tax=Mariprofundus ferrooxydans PV-1 TaxID=314345 RepID=Q0EXZ3_9PROT|nr:hypothetical protein [Mariprofundus ferrooxydans]EAU54059.1 hypothetical protein SPV1_00477 [Mariprofundus ferrooxydans PV-1]KON48868.1 hypothetical protein AL013_00595 [Mariprofundus ferrooxydans]